MAVDTELNESVFWYFFSLILEKGEPVTLCQSPWLIQHEGLSWTYLAWSCPKHLLWFSFTSPLLGTMLVTIHMWMCAPLQTCWGWCFQGMQELSFPLFFWVGCFVRVENKRPNFEHRCLPFFSHVWQVFSHLAYWQDGMSSHHCDFTDWHVISQLIFSISSDCLCASLFNHCPCI